MRYSHLVADRRGTRAKPFTGEGWAVHVYDSDRHLRFTLEPSHIWAFSWGIGVGLLVAIVRSALLARPIVSQVIPSIQKIFHQLLKPAPGMAQCGSLPVHSPLG